MKTPSQITCQAICDYFKLGAPSQRPIPLEGGRINQQWTVHTSEGQFVIKRLNPKRAKNKKALERFIQTNTVAKQFSQYVNASSALQINHSPLYQHHDIFYMVYPYVVGTVLEQNDLTQSHTEKMAKLLSTLHQSPINITLPKEKLLFSTIDDIEKVTQKLKKKYPEIVSQVDAIQTTLLQILTQYEKNNAFFETDRLISHCDLDVKNVVWDQNNAPVLIDWEYASHINRYVDLNASAIYWSMDNHYRVSEQLFTLFLTHYCNETQTRLSETQLNLGLIGMLASWISWLLFNLNQLTNAQTTPYEKDIALAQSHISFHAIPYMSEQQSRIIDNSFSKIITKP